MGNIRITDSDLLPYMPEPQVYSPCTTAQSSRLDEDVVHEKAGQLRLESGFRNKDKGPKELSSPNNHLRAENEQQIT